MISLLVPVMMITFIILCSINNAVVVRAASMQFTAMFAFGDSLTDPGNNNYLLNSLAKANYFPYGLDFCQGPSGRFSNGRTSIDYLGDLLEIPLLPAYADPLATVKNILRGVNYASAGAGILDETGQHLGERFSLSEQIENFQSTLNQLKNEMDGDEMAKYLTKALVVMTLGSNDYINNYLQPSFYTTSYFYNPQDYADLLMKHYTRHILAIHALGLKKFFLGGVGPLGCIPNQLASGIATPGKCVAFVNDIVKMFNMRLKSLVEQLNTDIHHGSVFVFGNTYDAFTEILHNASAYGFTVTDRACCGIGTNISSGMPFIPPKLLIKSSLEGHTPVHLLTAIPSMYKKWHTFNPYFSLTHINY